jgi:hypothetical protein
LCDGKRVGSTEGPSCDFKVSWGKIRDELEVSDRLRRSVWGRVRGAVGDSYNLVNFSKHLLERYGYRATYGVIKSDNYIGKIDGS